MKTRIDFVTNSSSSSYIIGLKKGKLTKQLLTEVLKPGSLGVEEQVIDYLLRRSDQITPAWVKDNIGGEGEDLDNRLLDLLKKGYSVFYEGSASDEGDRFECFMCSLELNYEDGDIIIQKDGGFCH